MVGWVGQDGFGDLILNRLRGDGVEVSGIWRTDRLPTGTVFVTYRKDGSREFIFNLANSASSLMYRPGKNVGLGQCGRGAGCD
jgi:sugar/nucleoside kinase (ribokinase family)